MIEADFVQRRRRGVARDVAAVLGALAIRVHDHRHRVPADVRLDAPLDRAVAGILVSWPGEIVLTYAVFGLNGRYAPERRVKSIRLSSRKCARSAPCALSTESIDSSHSLVSSGSRSSNLEASDMSGVLRHVRPRMIGV